MVKEIDKDGDELIQIKKNVSNAYLYFKHNYENFHTVTNFVFRTGVSDDDRAKLAILDKPTIEFNILESYISRLRGEFSKQEPSILVSSKDGEEIHEKVIDSVQGHMLSILQDANNSSFEYKVYTDQLGGGFSAMEVLTDYEDEMAFNQKIEIRRAYDPTLCFFDPLAVQPHKADGRFCGKLYPKSKEDFKREYPKIDISEVKFTRAVEGDFSWTYQNGNEEILMMCDYYEKKFKKVKIVQLANGKVLPKKDYEDYVVQWNAAGHIEQPAIIISERVTEVQTICRYRLIGDKILEYKETIFKYFPLIFVDGNSVTLRTSINGAVQQVTRPYVWNAIGTQRLKNMCGQTLANEIENLVQSKFKVAMESLPVESKDYLDAYTNPQQANLLVYKSVLDGQPGTQLPPPMEIARSPIPQEIIQTFMACDQAIQAELGSYDASMGKISDNDLSGLAMIESSTQSNVAAMPYVVSFLQALNQAALIIVDLIPKIHRGPRSLATINEDGEKEHVKVNQRLHTGQPAPGSIQLSQAKGALDVKVEAGINFGIQKTRSLQQIGVMSRSSPLFQEFINTKGLKVLIKNMEVYAGDQLEELADEFMAEKKQEKMMQMKMMQQQAQAQGQQQNPMVQRNQIEMAKLQQKQQQDQARNQIDSSQQGIDMIKVQNERDKVLMEAQRSQTEAAVRMEESQTERAAKHVELTIEAMKEGHRQHSDHRQHTREDVRLHHDILQANKPAESAD